MRIALESGSGPRVARIFHRLLGCVLLAAWLSLGAQVQLLIGSDGLLPLAPWVERLQAGGIGWLDFPSLLVLAPSDRAIHAGVALGVALALLAIAGLGTRLALLLSAPLYLSYALACRDFTSFQWDNLLVESCVLAAWLPRHRAAPGPHWLMRLLLFKLYLESGIAKAQSHLGDWLDGSAMSFYYETAPLPAWPAWYAHHLPDSWHRLETWGALGLEAGVAFLILGPRSCRLAALVGFSGFQLFNLATANYGFFVYLTLALHVFLLDDRDCERFQQLLPARPRELGHAVSDRVRRFFEQRPRLLLKRFFSRGNALLPAAARRVGRGCFALFAAWWICASLMTAGLHFSRSESLRQALLPIERSYRSLRIANAYHLFGHITRERVEPEFQTRQGDDWTAHPLRYKPGDPARPPRFAAPHQPRVDFNLWFYGLSYERGTPGYVASLLERLCHDPAAVQTLFPEPLPAAPEAVRIEFWRYRFSPEDARENPQDWWTRESVASLRPVRCRRESEF